jgi:hypothetical protein
MVDSSFFTLHWKHVPYKSWTSSILYLGLTSSIWTSPSTEGLTFENSSKWNTCVGLNLNHWVCMFPNRLNGNMRVQEAHNFIHLLQEMFYLLQELLNQLRTISGAVKNQAIDSLNLPTAGATPWLNQGSRPFNTLPCTNPGKGWSRKGNYPRPRFVQLNTLPTLAGASHQWTISYQQGAFLELF